MGGAGKACLEVQEKQHQTQRLQEIDRRGGPADFSDQAASLSDQAEAQDLEMRTSNSKGDHKLLLGVVQLRMGSIFEKLSFILSF